MDPFRVHNTNQVDFAIFKDEAFRSSPTDVPKVTTFEGALHKAIDRKENPMSKEAYAQVLTRARTEEDYRAYIPTSESISESFLLIRRR